MDEKERSLFEKLLRLALCPSATPGEWNVAAQKLVSLMRNTGTQAEEILATPEPYQRRRYRRPSGIPREMPFGKYKGHALEVIARNDPSYLFWVLANVQWLDPVLREEIKKRLYEQRRPT